MRNFYSTNASIVIVNEAYELKQPVKATLIVSRMPTLLLLPANKYQDIMEQQLTGFNNRLILLKRRPGVKIYLLVPLPTWEKM
jgi:UDP-3-O-[3-hydroxymyristoyl] glucosamine N-acyltransferase